jgi:hypothetical protein
MVDPNDQPKVAAFFKEAFQVDGDVEFITPEALQGLIRTHRLSVMRLHDSKRGIFYVGTFKPKPTGTPNPNHGHS